MCMNLLLLRNHTYICGYIFIEKKVQMAIPKCQLQFSISGGSIMRYFISFFLSVFSHFSIVDLYYSFNFKVIKMCPDVHSAESLSSSQPFQKRFAHGGPYNSSSPCSGTAYQCWHHNHNSLQFYYCAGFITL